jgi:hypothetical protein
MTSYRTVSFAAIPIALIVLLAVTPITGSASAASPAAGPAPSTASDQWAYGANYSASGSWTNTTGGYTANLTAFFGWDTILTQTNGRNGSIALEAQRTTALDYWLTFCKPTCALPSISGNVTFRAWQVEDGFANLTTAGSVTVNGTQVPALALLNVTDRSQGNETATVTGIVHGLFNIHTAMYYFSVNASSSVSVAFTPALGLVPNALSPWLSWNSSSDFVASGSWGADFSYLHIPVTGAQKYVYGPLSGSVARTGVVGLKGEDLGAVVLKGGLSTSAASITVQGPFHIHEGFLVLPSQADIFGSSGSAWSGYQNDTAVASTATMNMGGASSHVGILASSTALIPEASSPSSVTDVDSVGAIPSVSSAPSVIPSSTIGQDGATVQGEPESVPGASNESSCLVAGTCYSPPGAASSKHASGIFGVIVVGLLVGTLVALAVVVSRRRAVPPPPSPNARLYPPVGRQTTSSPATPPSVRSEPPADDPLGHLW